jgi:hypothetical protein
VIGLWRRGPALIGPRWGAQPRTPFLRGSYHAQRPAEGSALFLGLLAFYVALLALATLAQSGLLKALANVYALVIFGLVAFAWATREHPTSRWASAAVACAVVYVAGLVCGLVVNPDNILWGDLLKIALAPAFLVFGAAFERARAAAGERELWHNGSVRISFAVLLLVPMLTLAAQYLQSGFEVDGVRETSIFANRNNAAVYVVTLFGLLHVIRSTPLRWWLRWLIGLLCVVSGLFFGTLGVLIAVMLALTVALTKSRPRVVALLLFVDALFVAGYFFFPDFGPFKRFGPVIESLRLLNDGRINLHTVTFGDLVVLLKTQDLSFIFRLKHWADLLTVFGNGDLYNWLFGFGVGSSVRLSEIKLVPHNDYLRVGFEFGLVTLAAWVSMLGLVVMRCGRRWEAVPLVVVLLYLFSENLINNYVAMAFFYFSAGALAERIGAARAGSRGGGLPHPQPR